MNSNKNIKNSFENRVNFLCDFTITKFFWIFCIKGTQQAKIETATPTVNRILGGNTRKNKGASNHVEKMERI